MSGHSEFRIPDDKVAEVFAHAARLHAKDDEGYSLANLQQIGSEVGISPRLVVQALQKVEENRLRKRARRRQLRERVKLVTLFLIYVSILSVGMTLFLIYASILSLIVAILIAAIALCSIFISIQKPFYETFTLGHLKSLIPEDIAAEVIAEAARLQARKSEGQSLADLQKICAEAGIPPHTVEKAFREIEEKLRRKQAKRQKQQAFIKSHASEGVAVAIGLLIPTALFMYGITPFGLIIVFCIFAGVAILMYAVAEREVMLREDFRSRVMCKTKEEVIQAVGRPRRTSEFSGWSTWYYCHIKDPASHKLGSAIVTFSDNNVAVRVDFTTH